MQHITNNLGLHSAQCGDFEEREYIALHSQRAETSKRENILKNVMIILGTHSYTRLMENRSIQVLETEQTLNWRGKQENIGNIQR